MNNILEKLAQDLANQMRNERTEAFCDGVRNGKVAAAMAIRDLPKARLNGDEYVNVHLITNLIDIYQQEVEDGWKLMQAASKS